MPSDRVASRALREAERVFFHQSPMAMLVIDRESVRAVAANQAALALYGYSSEELQRLPLEKLWPTASEEELRQRVRTLVDGGQDATGLARHQRKDGELFDVELVSRPTIFRGRPSLLSVVVDVTHRFRAQGSDRERLDVQRRRIGELDAANERIQEVSRLKSEFLANMSHELRTPLNAVIGFAKLMHAGKAGPTSDTQKEYLGDILTSSRHLLGLIDDVLDLAMIEAGRLVIRRTVVDVPNVLREIDDTLGGIAADKHVSVATHIDPSLVEVVTDGRALKQILYNYLSNAIKFTPPEGSVTVRIVGDGAAFFSVDVEDTGIGVKAEDIPRLFVEFQQLDSGRTKQYQGTGLGLALTKRLVEAMGGAVSVESTPLKGSRFSARLPLIASAASQRVDPEKVLR